MKFASQEYWNKKIGYNILSRLFHYEKMHERIKIDFMLHEETETYWKDSELITRKYQTLTRSDIWTDESCADLNRDGYRRCYGLYDSLVWYGVPVYLRIRGEYNAQDEVRTKTDDAGHLVYSQDTAATLHDFLQSKAAQNFLKGMGRTQMSQMDTQKMVMLAILGCGVIFGMYMMGVF